MSWNDVDVNPYDPSTQDLQPETKPPDEIIRMAIANALMNARVMMPCKVTKVLGNQLVNVQITLQSRYIDGTVVNIPEIQNVPVRMPVGNGWSIKLPVKVGDLGDVSFCDRSLQVWKSGTGDIVDPQDNRMHDLTDAVFLPGLVPKSQQTTDTTTDMVLTNGESQVRLLENGGIELLNHSTGQQLVIDDTKITLSNDGITKVELDTSTIKIANTATSLGAILTQLMTDLTTVATALGTNPGSEPAAAAAGTSLAASATAIQILITELLT